MNGFTGSELIWGSAGIPSTPQTMTDIANIGNAWLTEPVSLSPQPAIPAPTWLERIWSPISTVGQQLGEKTMQTYQAVTQSLPDVLWGWAGQKLGLVPKQENADTTVYYSQAPHAGGEPAQGPQVIVSPQGTAPIGVPYPVTTQAGSTTSILIVVGIGLLIFLFMPKGK